MSQDENSASDPPPESSNEGSNASPLRSEYTDSFPHLLRELGVSLAVTTYQAGYLIILRVEDSGLNTHFRRFPRPMGMTARLGRVALGITREIVDFRDMRAVAAKLEPAGTHDACYLPRKAHITGDIDIHEMAWAGEELWFVNTKFSCLCTLDASHSFVPRWRPPFVSALSDTDRCHLNGLCVHEGRPRYVTALGDSDNHEGWRKNKARGGVLLDVDSGETILSGLSMPHSPRWHNGRLWLLESGDGSIGTVDLASGKYQPHARVNGFTRGVSFIGEYAFIGLSQVRESAIFSGIPLTDRVKQRICGVSAVHLPSGREVGFVRFKDAVQEIFSVELLRNRFPDFLEPNHKSVGNSYALPDQALSDVAQPANQPTGTSS